MTTKKRYRLVHGQQVLKIHVDSVDEIVDSKDPAPFKGQILDDDFLDYVESLSDETSYATALKIEVHIKHPPIQPREAASISQALSEHFDYKIERKKGEIRKQFRTSRLLLLYGLSILLTCLVLAHFLRQIEPSIIRTTLTEGLTIFGWVSLWRPLDLLLFDWYPMYDRIRYFRKIAQAEVVLVYG